MVVARKLRNLLVTYANACVFLADDLSAGEDWETRMRMNWPMLMSSWRF
jgi:hypothetical protein